MPSWIMAHKPDIVFVVSIAAGLVLIVGGLFGHSESTILLGAGIVGVPGFSKVANDEQK